jgi:hypothetical protein
VDGGVFIRGGRLADRWVVREPRFIGKGGEAPVVAANLNLLKHARKVGPMKIGLGAGRLLYGK